MPRILKEGQQFPTWCQLSSFRILEPGGDGLSLTADSRKQRIVAVTGSLNIRQGDRGVVLAPGQFLDLERGQTTLVEGLGREARAVHLAGDWSGEVGGCGVFSAVDTDAPSDRGDPVDYPKTTSIDSHYHDCDEYWILLEGRATVVVSGEAAEMRPGDCLCIGMGRHHDMPHAPEPIRAVYFETGLERGKRLGHLWEHTHGPAERAEGRD